MEYDGTPFLGITEKRTSGFVKPKAKQSLTTNVDKWTSPSTAPPSSRSLVKSFFFPHLLLRCSVLNSAFSL